MVEADCGALGYCISHPGIVGQPPPLDTVLGRIDGADCLYIHDLCLLPVAILAVLVPGHATMALAQFVTVILLVYRAYVAHVALEVGVGTAAGVVLLDVLLAALLKAVSDKLMAM